MEQQRIVLNEDGPITYTLVRKRVKNLNLCIGDGGEVRLSIPMHCPIDQADDFVRRKRAWIMEHRRPPDRSLSLLPELSREECYRTLSRALDAAHPLVEPLGVKRPLLKIRTMRTQWGNCHWAQGYITLNTELHRCPERLRVYVALHELVHFLHHDHGAGFYTVMDTLMPDWRSRRQELKEYIQIVRK